MSAEGKLLIELREYKPQRFSASLISTSLGEILWLHYSTQIAVEFPSPKTDKEWQLTSQGWVGYIPLSDEIGISLQPRVPLGNLFGMLEYAYQLKSLHFLEGLFQAKSLEEFYERIANILVSRILDRGRRGFYRAYLARTESLPYVRGQFDVTRLMQMPWDVKLLCNYQEQTSDIDDNRILNWTLHVIGRSGLLTERAAPNIRRAYQTLQGLITLQPYDPRACVGRFYNRLNQDYRPLHALCRFFLEHSGPRHEIGNRTMLPFLVDMARLYELFVAEWLKAHLPKTWDLKAQDRANIGEDGDLYFDIDLVLYTANDGIPVYVLDTKYKTPDRPSSGDIAQVIAYAQLKGCHEAVLVYPTPLAKPIDVTAGNIRVRSLAFSLEGDLEKAGKKFLQDLSADNRTAH